MIKSVFVLIIALAITCPGSAQMSEIRWSYHIPEKGPGEMIRHPFLKSSPGGFIYRLRFVGTPWDTRGFTKQFRLEFALAASAPQDLSGPNVSEAENTLGQLDRAAIQHLMLSSSTTNIQGHTPGQRSSGPLFQNYPPIEQPKK